MKPPTIRPARPDEYDEIARVWMNSWVSTGLEDAGNFLLAKLRARINVKARQLLPDEIELRCVRENEKAWRWYEREGFVFEKEEVEPMTGFVMKYYRWKKQGTIR